MNIFFALLLLAFLVCFGVHIYVDVTDLAEHEDLLDALWDEDDDPRPSLEAVPTTGAAEAS